MTALKSWALWFPSPMTREYKCMFICIVYFCTLMFLHMLQKRYRYKTQCKELALPWFHPKYSVHLASVRLIKLRCWEQCTRLCKWWLDVRQLWVWGGGFLKSESWANKHWAAKQNHFSSSYRTVISVPAKARTCPLGFNSNSVCRHWTLPLQTPSLAVLLNCLKTFVFFVYFPF